ncbi:hypothetical protein DPMN_001145 [Dreissena polymorpha]|uniref:Uncharacterized protein n=1 Tax=Dreissena polymorpha TaxID=45954 RepID=A0A9D4MGS0_DREPO|nr:hypothetical protein DPMN_001145 [Dreissena polymorpha]
MELLQTIVILCSLLSCVELSQLVCSISDKWRDMPMEERLLSANTVVYGKTIQHKAGRVSFDAPYVINAVFDVYCVFKAGAGVTVNEQIVIQGISPRNGCSGTKEHMQIGNEAVVMIQRSADGNFQYDEVMPRLSATIPATVANLNSISVLCGLQTWAPPTGEGKTTNRCPICGVSNFTSTVIQATSEETEAEFQPCFFGGSFVTDANECNQLRLNATATSECIPASFGQTCANVLFDIANANCTCTTTDMTSRQSIESISLASQNEPGFSVTALSCVCVLILFNH